MASKQNSLKSLACTSGTTATYSPISDDEIIPYTNIPVGNGTMRVLDVEPLASRPPAQAARPGAVSPGLERGRPASPVRSRSAGRQGRGLSPSRTIAKKVFRADSPRPRVGALTPKAVPIRKLFPNDPEEAKSKELSDVPRSPSYTIRGGPTPNGGWGKVLIPRHRENVLRGDASIEESIDSTPPRRTVKRCAKPPPIRVPPGQFEDSEEEKEGEKETLASLKTEIAALKKRNARLEERQAESELWKWEISDRLDILRKGFSSKFRRLVEATGHQDIYDPPMP
jgi:hypothetical protein